MAVEYDGFNGEIDLVFNVPVNVAINPAAVITVFSQRRATTLRWGRVIYDRQSVSLVFTGDFNNFLAEHFADFAPLYVNIPPDLVAVSGPSATTFGNYPLMLQCWIS